MQISQISEKLPIKDKRIWRVVTHYIEDELKKADFSNITSVGVDETSRWKGHEYITVFADIHSGRVIYICKGKDSSTLSSFSDALKDHKGTPEQIKDICCDMSPAFIKGIEEEFPLSSIIFDKFRIIKLVNEVVDEVRRLEQVLNRILKNTRYLWLKNSSSLTKKQLKVLGGLKEMNLKTVRSYSIKLSLQEFWKWKIDNLQRAILKKGIFGQLIVNYHP